MRIAIVGSGVAGLTCARLLDRHHDVVLFEADDRPGGHANTVEVDDPGVGPIGVDTGFIVHNDRNYPNLLRLFAELGVATLDTEMSFAVTDRTTGFHYRATNLNTLLAERTNALRPKMWRMLADIARFYRHANRYLVDGRDDLTLAEFLDHHGYGDTFRHLHLIPMGAAVWSSDPSRFDEFPAASLFHFLSNHGLLSVGDRPQWRTVQGGSRRYVEALLAAFGGEVRLSTPVAAVRRLPVAPDGDRAEAGVTVRPAEGAEERFDRVVLACHSDQALRMLTDADRVETEVLGSMRYQPNRATLHTDTRLLPPRRRAWAAWNYDRLGPDDTEPAVTYDLTNLQRLPGARRYLVSLNAEHRIDPATVIAGFDYTHPVFDTAAVNAQRRFEEIDGVNGVHFCGAYWGHGFHEDGMVSALRVCERIDGVATTGAMASAGYERMAQEGGAS